MDSTTRAPTLTATAAYLRFPLTEDHRSPVQDGSRCVHCRATHVQKWGRASGRQRFRCCACRRTFSTFTGTALQNLKRPELWRKFLWCIDGRLTVRQTGAVLGVDKDTALRWRHRLLDQWRAAGRRTLAGAVVVGRFWVPHSAKGVRYLQRPPRHRGEPWSFPPLQTGPVTVLVAWSNPREVVLESFIGDIRRVDYARRLQPRLGGVTEILGVGGPFTPLALFARGIGAEYVQERRSFFPRRVWEIRRDLRSWLRPFRGVSTRRLNNYLEWYRRRGLRVPPDQQHPRTERYGASPKQWPRGGPGKICRRKAHLPLSRLLRRPVRLLCRPRGGLLAARPPRDPPRLKQRHQPVHGLLHRGLLRPDHRLRILRRLVRARNTGHVPDLARIGLGI